MIKILHKFEESMISLLLVTITLLVFFEVILRFVFNEGLLWAQEVTLYLGAWLVLMGAAWGIREGAHIGVDALVRHLSPKRQKLATLFAIAMALVYCGLFLYGGWVYLSKMRMIGIEMEDLPIQKWQAMSCLIFGFLLLAWRLIALGVRVIQGQQFGFGFADEAKESMHLAEELADAGLVGDHDAKNGKGVS